MSLFVGEVVVVDKQLRMKELPKKIKRQLRELTEKAYDEELSRELIKLDQQFMEWKNGEISADDMNYSIHEYHQGPSRKIWSKYQISSNQLAIRVAAAIVEGVLDKTKVEPEVLKHIEREIQTMEDFLRE